MESVYCEDCDFVHTASRREPPWRWLCTKFKRSPDEGYGYVTRGTWDNAPPYRFCRHVNPVGQCSTFEPKREIYHASE